MNGNAYYSNKCWVRKAMTILLSEMIMFETLERSKENGAFGEYELGITFCDKHGDRMTFWPTDQSDLNEINETIS